MRVRAASADFCYERGAATFGASPAFLRKWQNPRVFAYFGPPRAPLGPLSARKWASRLRRLRFLAAARWPRFYAYDRRTRVGAYGMRDGRGFVAIYGTSGPHPPKQAKIRLFLGGCVLTPSERSYPRDWSAGRAPLFGGAPGCPRSRSQSRGYDAISCPKNGKKGRNSRGIPHFAREVPGSESCPLDPLCYSRAMPSDPPPRLCATFGDPCDEIVTAGVIRGGIYARNRANPSGFWRF